MTAGLTGLGVLCVVFALALGGLAAAATPAAPAWSIRTTAQPTHFTAGSTSSLGIPYPEYAIDVFNVGAAPSEGTVTIRDSVPAGVAVLEATGWEQQERSFPCTISGQTVTCTDPEAVEAGGWLHVTIRLEVPPGTNYTLTNSASIWGGGAAPAVSPVTVTPVTQELAVFSFLSGSAGFSALLGNGDATAPSQAGSHPYHLSVHLGFPTKVVEGGGVHGVGTLRDSTVLLPRGFVVDPQATPVRCTEAQLEQRQGGLACPLASQVGTVAVYTTAGAKPVPVVAALFNMEAPPGSPAELGFDAIGAGIDIHLLGEVRSDGRYELGASARDILARPNNPILGVDVDLWGDPTDPGHGFQRAGCSENTPGYSCPLTVQAGTTPFLTMPSACSDDLELRGEANSWQEPSRMVEASAVVEDVAGNVVPVEGCSRLAFSPTLELTPEARSADTATGLEVDLHVPQTSGLNTLATANVKDVTVDLPPGLVLNPSASNGLAACTEAQLGEGSDEPATCPDASKIGTVEVDTPLLDHPLPGAIYVAKPYENPFGSLLAIYIAVHDPASGVVIKLAGHVEPDGQTGQLTTTFSENPELPFENFRLDFFGGPRAALRTPTTCGSPAYATRISPWSGTAPVSATRAIQVDSGAGGAACASSEAALPNGPSFEAGATNPLVSSYSPFVLHLKREDGSQVFRALNVSLPPGMVGRLAAIPYCPDSALAAAAARSGAEEQASPSCPPASEVGRVTVASGAGSTPVQVSGRAYLAGPYKGAPLSLAIVTPAVAGPFDLGTVVVRSALQVDLRTAQITATSDPIPTILKGIPLDVRSISVELDRHEFTRTPSSCEAMAMSGQLASTTGNVAPLSNRFQVGGCGDLTFPPRLKLHVKGATRRTGHPALKAVVTFPKKGNYANIARAQVGLPHSEFLDQGNLNKVCRQADLMAGTCPKKSIYGHAKAWTPLLEKPLQGPVYLGVGFGYKLPALVADLNGQIRILLVGKVDTTKRKGIRNTFEVVPDAPVSRFVLRMKGGRKYGLLENSENLCRKAQRASARFVAHDGDVKQMRPKITNGCKKARHKKRSKHSSAGGKKKD